MALHLSLKAACAAFVFTTAFSAATASAAPPHRKIDQAVTDALRAGTPTQHVIISVFPGCRASLRAALDWHGDTFGAEHAIIDAVSVEVHSADLEVLSQNPCVKSVAEDAPVRASGGAGGHNGNRTSPPLTELPSQDLTSTLRDTLGLPHSAALDPSVPTGAGGIGVAIIDSGIAPSPDFSGRITGFYDFTRHRARSTAPYDDYGHGTHIAGLIGSSGVLSNFEFQGVAPDVRLVGLKVLDETGAGKTSDVINAIEFVIANRARLNVQVINLSLGHPIFAAAADDPLVQAVEQASAAGLIVVASAGNFGQKQSDGTVGYAGLTSPGNAPSAITAGAVMTKDTASRLDDEVAPYSSRGPTWFDGFVKPDVVAPGHRLASDTNVSSYLYQQFTRSHGQSKTGQPLLLLSGSSMAAGVTSGVVALMLQAHNQAPFPNRKALTPNLVKAILQYTAISVGNADYLTQGAGQINAHGALLLSKGIDTSRPVGSAWLQAPVPFSPIGGASYTWSQHVLYGNRALKGALLSVNSIAWATNVVWGTADREGDNIVWGTAVDREDDNIVWGTASDRDGDNIVWGTNIVWSSRVVGQRLGGSNVVWGGNIVWGDNIVWGALRFDNVVWGTIRESDNIVWGTTFGGDLVWGRAGRAGVTLAPAGLLEGDNLVWGTGAR